MRTKRELANRMQIALFAHDTSLPARLTAPIAQSERHKRRTGDARPTSTKPAPRARRKPERFIRTLLGGWAYGAIYGSSRERTAALDGWLWTYNDRRPHGALSHKSPIARLNELNNLAGSYI